MVTEVSQPQVPCPQIAMEFSLRGLAGAWPGRRAPTCPCFHLGLRDTCCARMGAFVV